MSTVQRLERMKDRNGGPWGLAAMAQFWCFLPLLAVILLVTSGCSSRQDHKTIISNSAPAKPSEFFQTHADRMATIGMRNNLNSLYRLMDKLYLRNPREWRKTGLPDAEAAKAAVHRAIESDQPLPQLGGRKDIAALSYALSAEYQGDRVGAFIYSLASMLITAHGGRTEYYMSDTINPEFVHNAARNIEIAGWMLAQRTDAEGKPWLLSNEISADGRNLSYAVEFGKIVARLDLLTDVLDERYRRLGVNYAQSLLFMNLLPVQ